MKKLVFVTCLTTVLLSACEVEVRDGHPYHHYRGWEHRHYPDHHEAYNHGYHHDARGGEIIVRP